MDEHSLPQVIRERASVSPGGEHAWRMEDVPSVFAAATSAKLAMIGGQPQFLVPGGTCEPYWLSYDSTERAAGEPWPRYVEHSAAEVLAAFSSLCESTDFRKVALEWPFIGDKLAADELDPLAYLWFVIYFDAKGAS